MEMQLGYFHHLDQFHAYSHALQSPAGFPHYPLCAEGATSRE